MAGPTAQLLEQLPSIPTSPLLKGDRFNWTDSWSEFSEDLSTMVIVHCCIMGTERHIHYHEVNVQNSHHSLSFLCMVTTCICIFFCIFFIILIINYFVESSITLCYNKCLIKYNCKTMCAFKIGHMTFGLTNHKVQKVFIITHQPYFGSTYSQPWPLP